MIFAVIEGRNSNTIPPARGMTIIQSGNKNKPTIQPSPNKLMPNESSGLVQTPPEQVDGTKILTKKNNATKRHNKKTGVKAIYAKILPAVHFEGGETAEDDTGVDVLGLLISLTNAYIPQTTKATAAMIARVPMDMGILWHVFELDVTWKYTTQSCKELNCMTKKFSFSRLDSERALPAPNENDLRRCFSPGLLGGFQAVRLRRASFLRGQCAAGGSILQSSRWCAV